MQRNRESEEKRVNKVLKGGEKGGKGENGKVRQETVRI